MSLYAQPDSLEVRIDENELEAEDQYRFATAFFEAMRFKSLGEEDEALGYFLTCLQINPNDPTVNYEVGKYYLAEGESAKAEQYLNRALELDRDNIWVATTLWELRKHDFDHQAEKEALDRLRRLEPHNPEYMWEMAMVYRELHKPDSAIAMLDMLELHLGGNDAIDEMKVNIYMENGDYDAAESTLLDAINEAPTRVDVKGRLADFYSMQGRTNDAILVLEKILELDPYDANAHLRIAEFLFLQNDIDSAQAHLRFAMGSAELDIDTKVRVMSSFLNVIDSRRNLMPFVVEMMDAVISVHPEDAKGYALKADFIIRDGRVEESRKLWKTAVSLPNGDIWTVWQQIIQADAQLEWWDSLAVDAQMVIDRFPNQPYGYLYSGYAHTRLKEFDEAVEVLEEGELYALSNPEMRIEFKLELARAYHLAEEYELSDQYYSEILEAYPNNVQALNNWAYYLALRKERLPYARQLVERALELAPRQSNYWDTHAWILFQLGEYSDALVSVNRSIDYGASREPEVWEHKGDIHGALGQVEEALAAWRKAEELGGNAERLESKIDDIQ